MHLDVEADPRPHDPEDAFQATPDIDRIAAVIALLQGDGCRAAGRDCHGMPTLDQAQGEMVCVDGGAGMEIRRIEPIDKKENAHRALIRVMVDDCYAKVISSPV